MTLWVLGLNHQTAPVELRERAAFAGEALPRALGSLRDTPQIAEAVLLSTCNRTELYAVAESAQALDQWLHSQAGDLQGYLYQHADAEAVRLAQTAFARLDDSTVLLVGAGETIELAARHLSEGKVRRLLIANRTLAHAQELASRHGGEALPLTQLDRHLGEADIVFSATAAREPVIHREMVAKALRARRHKPMLLFDLAVPRDIEAEVGTLNDAFLYTVDDLERAVEDNRRGRREAAAEAEAIIDLQVSRFIETQQASAHQAPLRQLRAFGEATRAELLERARQQLANGKPADEVLELLAHGLTNRLLHPPTAALRAAALSGDADLTRAAERLFPATPGYRHPPVRPDDADPAP